MKYKTNRPYFVTSLYGNVKAWVCADGNLNPDIYRKSIIKNTRFLPGVTYNAHYKGEYDDMYLFYIPELNISIHLADFCTNIQEKPINYNQYWATLNA